MSECPGKPLILIPLDSRPVCYQMPVMLSNMAAVPLIVPPKSLLGQLKKPAPVDELFDWWRNCLNEHHDAGVIMALDTMAYGGLIAGRVNTETYGKLEGRVEGFFDVLGPTNHPRYGFSTILRIPNYNNDEEEPEYWKEYGSQLYRYSALFHQTGRAPEGMGIPSEVIGDFINRRRKNNAVNQTYLDRMITGSLDYLAYGQDDTGPYGLNVQEARELLACIRRMGLASKAHVQTGADELASLMMAKALLDSHNEPLNITPVYFPKEGYHTHALFDGIPIAHIVERQIQTLGAHIVDNPEEADLLMVCHVPLTEMGDHCSGIEAKRSRAAVGDLIDYLEEWLPDKPVALADVTFANGADPWLMEACLEQEVPLQKLAAYAAWNTPGNTIGTALAMGSLVVLANRRNQLDDTVRRGLLFTRLLDDWVYQSNVRQLIRTQSEGIPSPDRLKSMLSEGIETLSQQLEMADADPEVFFPCNRTFEIEVDLGEAYGAHHNQCSESFR